ncbi:MAG: ferrous iron transport protein B [Candidatus Omnitrophica bacterium]|nr:ferrous iron transport protein B [Candidatus Omnitrophota bacterium]
MKKIKINVALAGNPNSGKSTIFNNITGARQHVGNYPGVTVEKKEGKVDFKGYELNIIDLPGTYGLSAYSEDEVVARDFIIKEKPDVIVHIVDSSNLERNLYLGTQLMELDIPLVFVMNMSDMAEKNRQFIDYKKLSDLLGTAVIPTVGNKNLGTDKILDTIVKIYEGKMKIKMVEVDYGSEINEEIIKITSIIKREKDLISLYPLNWLVIKVLENDPEVMSIVNSYATASEVIAQKDKSRQHLYLHFGDNIETIIADRRYGFVSGACLECLKITVEERHNLSDRIDKVILNRVLGLPIFAMVMYLIFKFTFTFSEPMVGWFESFFELLSSLAVKYIPDGLVQSFVVDGLIGGVGGVLGFFPLVLFMFFAIAFFEDSGYMARAAFVMDRIMSKFGLHGKSFLPMMISTNGCAVPGIMATRTLSNKRDRLITMMVTPFMICGAKLPIFALFIGAFFSAEYGTDIMFIMYILSVIIAFVSAWVLKKLVFQGETSHFVMELPPYRLPSFTGLLLKMWERGRLYLKKAGTIIVVISIMIWAGFTFPIKEAPDSLTDEAAASFQIEESYAGRIGKFIESVVRPIGMDWRGGVALIAGVAAKEVVVSTLGTIYSLGEVDAEAPDSLKEVLQKDKFWNPLKAVAFLMFSLIYLPCFVAMAVFYRESGSSIKWTFFLIFWTSVMAWGAAFIVYQGGTLLGIGV